MTAEIASTGPGQPLASDRAQREHYDRIIAEYETHYDDPTSRVYRRRFIYEPLLGDVDLRGARVLEAMCGTGQATAYLRERGARVTGLDVSPAAIDAFRTRWPDCEAVQASILDSGLDGGLFDAVVVIGGLHHVHPHVHRAVDEIHRLLRPGGRLCFGEPHAGSLPDLARRWWYRRDPLFERGEAAIDLGVLAAANASRFEIELERYVGSIAYLAVLNSMVFRIPPRLKRLYARPLCLLERGLGVLHTRRTSCFALGRWRKGRPRRPAENTPDFGRDTMSPAMPEAVRYHRWILDRVEPRARSPLLEIGFGYGQYTRALARRVERIVAVDIDPRYFETADVPPRVELRRVDITDPRLAETVGRETFASVVCLNVLEHIEDDVAVLGHFREAMRPGGTLMLLVPAHPALYGRMDVLAGHYRRYTRRGLVDRLRAARFEVRRARYFNPLGGLGWWLNARFTRHESLAADAVSRQIRLYDRFVQPVSRLLDPAAAPVFGQSLWAVAVRPPEGD